MRGLSQVLCYCSHAQLTVPREDNICIRQLFQDDLSNAHFLNAIDIEGREDASHDNVGNPLLLDDLAFPPDLVLIKRGDFTAVV